MRFGTSAALMTVLPPRLRVMSAMKLRAEVEENEQPAHRCRFEALSEPPRFRGRIWSMT